MILEESNRELVDMIKESPTQYFSLLQLTNILACANRQIPSDSYVPLGDRMIMQMIYRLRLAAKKVEGDRDFQAQMKEEPARSLFPIPGILSTLKEEKQKKEEELNPEEAIVSIVENTVLEMKEEEEKEKQKAEEIKNKNSEKEETSDKPSEVTFSPILPVDMSEEWW